MFQLQELPTRRRRRFDGTRYIVDLRHGGSTFFDVPEGVHFLRLRLAADDKARFVVVTGTPVVGGSVKLDVRPDWHSYFVPVSGPAAGSVTFSADNLRRAGERFGVLLASLAVVDAGQKNREEAADPPRAPLPDPEVTGPSSPAAAGVSAGDRYLASVEKSWDFYGAADPMFYILTDERYRNRGWDLQEFFNIGRGEIAGALDWVDSQRIPLRRRVALDFGCGIGRLTQAMARHFDVVHGIDIAPSMVDAARRLNVHGRRVVYHHSNSPTLPFPERTFDFIYTNIVLQHMRPQYIRSYLDQFVRLLAPGGVLIFQLPSSPLLNWQGIKLRLLPEKNWYPESNGQFTARMEFHWIHRRKIVRHFSRQLVRVADVRKDFSAPAYSFRYCVRKHGEALPEQIRRAA